jgi:hypothetical protein
VERVLPRCNNRFYCGLSILLEMNGNIQGFTVFRKGIPS